MWMIRRVNTEKYGSVMDDMSSLLSQFSDGSNVIKMHAKHSEHVKLWIHAIIAVTVIASSGLSLASSGLALEAAIGAKLAMNAGKPIAKGSGLLKESLNFPSNVLKGVNGLEAGASSYVQDIMTSSDYASGVKTAVKHIMTQNQDMATKLFDANMLSVLEGSNGMIAEMTIVDVVQSRLYANTTSLTPDFETQLRYLWTASAIGTMWSTENTYIIASDVGDGGCEADGRGHPSLKACLSEYPDKVFYTFFETNAREGINDRALMRGPPGHDMLKEATNFTITDVVRASMATFEQFQNKDSGSLKGVTGFQTLFGNASAMGNGGGSARGLSNLPVCYTPGGEAITSINSKEGLNYPCICSTFGSGSRGQRDELTEEEEYQSQNDTKLSKRTESGGTWTGDVQATHDFLVVSGIYNSGDYRQFCQRNKSSWKFWQQHGNKCEIDKSHTWSWPNNSAPQNEPTDEKEEGGVGDKAQAVVSKVDEAIARQNYKAGIIEWVNDKFGRLFRKVKEKFEKIVPSEVAASSDDAMHPFKGCVSNPHTVVGCEEPNNDGHHENTGCGSTGGKSRFSQGLEASIAEMITGWETAAAAANGSEAGSDKPVDNLDAMMEADVKDLIDATESEGVDEDFENWKTGAD
jgi:hypothetical protein